MSLLTCDAVCSEAFYEGRKSHNSEISPFIEFNAQVRAEKCLIIIFIEVNKECVEKNGNWMGLYVSWVINEGIL